MGFSRQGHWSGLPCPAPGELPNPGIKPVSPALLADSLPAEPPGKPPATTYATPFNNLITYQLTHLPSTTQELPHPPTQTSIQPATTHSFKQPTTQPSLSPPLFPPRSHSSLLCSTLHRAGCSASPLGLLPGSSIVLPTRNYQDTALTTARVALAIHAQSWELPLQTSLLGTLGPQELHRGWGSWGGAVTAKLPPHYAATKHPHEGAAKAPSPTVRGALLARRQEARGHPTGREGTAQRVAGGQRAAWCPASPCS